MKLASAVVALVPCLLSTVARADSAPETHDGFLLRLSLGFGYESWTVDDGFGTQIDITGFGAGTSIGIGGMVAPNLAINADLFASAIASPNVAQNGVDLGEASDASVSLGAIGVGVTYWLMPVNVYLAGSIGLGQASVKENGSSFDADFGLALDFLVGKEFWVGREWGIGIAGQFIYANVPTNDSEASSSYMAFNVLFSATFN
ncbi:MAG: hypothetical protein U1F43_22310 [Myxococcota bacterium]